MDNKYVDNGIKNILNYKLINKKIKLSDEEKLLLIEILFYYKELLKKNSDDYCLKKNIREIESYL